MRQQVRKYVFKVSYHDQKIGETVCRSDRLELIQIAQVCSYAVGLGGAVPLNCVPDVEKGLVLVDSRGGGSFQK